MQKITLLSHRKLFPKHYYHRFIRLNYVFLIQETWNPHAPTLIVLTGEKRTKMKFGNKRDISVFHFVERVPGDTPRPFET